MIIFTGFFVQNITKFLTMTRQIRLQVEYKSQEQKQAGLLERAERANHRRLGLQGLGRPRRSAASAQAVTTPQTLQGKTWVGGQGAQVGRAPHRLAPLAS